MEIITLDSSDDSEGECQSVVVKRKLVEEDLVPDPRLPNLCEVETSSATGSVPSTVSKPVAVGTESDSDSDDSLMNYQPAFSQSSATSLPSTKVSSNRRRVHKASPIAKVARSRFGEATNRPEFVKNAKNFPIGSRTVTAMDREQEKRNRSILKQRQKEERAFERERKRQERQEQRVKEQELKRERSRRAQQAMGKFSGEEICVLVHPSLLQSLEATFQTIGSQYCVKEYAKLQPGSIHFIRKDFISGGASGAFDDLLRNSLQPSQLLSHVVVIFTDPKDFLAMLQRSDIDDDFPLLQAWWEHFQTSWKATWDELSQISPRVVVLLPGLMDEVNRQWNERARSGTPPITDAEIQDAIVWMLIQFQVECLRMPTTEKLTDFVSKMTRALSGKPYMNEVSELECIKKQRSELANAAVATPYEKAHDCWIRQLQAFPFLSMTRAQNIAQHYPTPQSMWAAYQDKTKTEDEKRLLVAGVADPSRRLVKLSGTLYRFMTSKDPREFI